MKIALMSDLHLEVSGTKGFNPDVQDADIVVLAGDIHKGVSAVDWASGMFEESVETAGNHEFWGGDRWGTFKEMSDFADTFCQDEVHLLEKSSFQKDDVLFIGATLWTDYNLYGNVPMSMLECQHGMWRDHHWIGNYGPDGVGENPRYLPQDMRRDHLLARAFIEQELMRARDDDSIRATVVVTHHVPSPSCIHPRYENDRCNPAFASNLDDIMHSDVAPNVWCFGHTHEPFDLMVGNTRLLCNPRGYPGERTFQNYEPLLFEV